MESRIGDEGARTGSRSGTRLVAEGGLRPAPAASPPPETARYEIVRELGRGGMGVVYEALDRERGQAVALKTLLRFGPAELYRFKQEFRTLADVQHPNLVRLYELIVTEDAGARFAMELVRGVDFITHVRAPVSLAPEAAREPTPTARPPRGDAAAIAPPEVRQATRADLEKLRRGLAQLVEGVQALHHAGKLHRDIKPSNVLVANDGRVVILDFGVATDLAHAREIVGGGGGEGEEIVGTAKYMAPEQALGEPPVAASDWYSVGAVLYEALVGEPPFVGSEMEVMTLKAELDPVAPTERVDGVPPELDALCRALLDRDPARRPSGPEILRRVGVTPSARPVASQFPLVRLPSLVGREESLGTLREAFETARAGRSVTITLGGASGMGKSAVAEHFLGKLVEKGEAAVLRGRAYERETVPYKAFDGVIDALSRYLIALDGEDVEAPLPADIGALARIFPVLRRVPRIHDAPEDAGTDPHIVRRRAFAALRELLGTLATRRMLALYIDDAQWGDADSASLLLELVRPPNAPPLLFVLTYRDNEAKESAFLKVMRGRWPGDEARLVNVVVGPLTVDEGIGLSLHLLGSASPSAQQVAAAVARESRGSPFLIEELVRTNRLAPGAGGGHALEVPTLERLVGERMDRLPLAARRLVEIVAVGGRPLPVSLVAEASGVGEGVEGAISAASARRFVHAGLRDGKEVVETSHDRFRETIVASLDAGTLREHHASLAAALEQEAGADAEAIAIHLLGAGESLRAATFLERAADQAAAQLAFGQAERQLALALEIVPSASPDAARLRVRLGEVLEWAGRGADAARAYLEAAKQATIERRVELQRAAAEQLLNSGRVDEGAAVLHRVLPAVGLQGPQSPGAALFWLIVYRIWGALLGARAAKRDRAATRPEDRAQIDALYAVAMGFSIIDVILGASMQARHTVVALRRGDRFQALRAISLETSHLASEGGKERGRERALVRTGLELLKAIEAEPTTAEPSATSAVEMHGPAFFQSNRGVALFLRGRWTEARAALDVAYERTRNHHAGWQANANLFGAYALYELGDLHELARRVDRLVSDAEMRGDLYTLVNLRSTMVAALCLVNDDVEGARRIAREAMARWSVRGYLVQHMQAMVGDTRSELYAGEGEEAFERTERDWRPLKKSFLLHVQFIRGYAFPARGCAAVAAAQERPSQRAALLAEARRISQRLERERMPWTSASAALIDAGVANVEGDRPRTLAALRTAIVRAEGVNMALLAAVARHRLGALLEGDEGAALTQAAVADLTGRGVRSVERFARIWLPGVWVR